MPLVSSLLLVASVGAMSPAVPDTTHYVVDNHGRPAGEMTVARTADSIVVRYGHIDRNRGRWVETRYQLGRDGAVIGGESRSLTRTGTPTGPSEYFRAGADSVRWVRGAVAGARVRGPEFYPLSNSTAWDQARLARHLLSRPERSTDLVPTGTARLEIAADTTVATARGPLRARMALLYSGPGNVPQVVWLDPDGELLASAAGWFTTVRRDAVPALPTLRAIEVAYRDREANATAKAIKPIAAGNLVIRNANVFDSERGVMRPNTSVVVSGFRIVAVGPADSVATPRGAQVIDGSGKWLVPGMWDMHTHFQITSQNAGVIRQLAGGITTIRDLAADTDIAASVRDRANRGELVSPFVILGGFIEGPGAWAGPSGALARTESEARALVKEYADLGYRQVKLYNLLHPDLVPAIADETHKRGMRLSGHVPRGLTVGAAIRLGFDEINHAAFLFSTFYQDSLYVPEMRPYSGVAARVAPNIDVDGPAMSALIADLVQHRTVVDGTFNLWMRDTTGADAAEAKRANGNYLRLIKRLHDAGVTLVAGTDGSSYNQELETYERAGIARADVLRISSSVPARVMGLGDNGSIAPGRIADLVLVGADPLAAISALREVELVVRAGRAYERQALMEALGMRFAARRPAASRSPDDDLH
jgi:imidazolonepropionase-like amidohydrolase